MEAGDENESQSSSERSQLSYSDLSTTTMEGSYVTQATSDSQDQLGNTGVAANMNTTAESKSDQTKPKTEDPVKSGDTDTNGVDESEQATKSDGDAMTKKKGKHKPLPDSDSDSDSSDGDSDYQEYLISRLSRGLNSRSVFEAHKRIMERKARGKDNQNQGSNLVKGLVDYLRVLDDRIDQLETNSVNKAKKAKEDEQNGRKSETGDTTVEVGVKFFNSVGHIEEDGTYLNVHDGSEGGTYMCDHDAKYLIRVLCKWVKENDAQPRGNPESEPANPEDIDILTFGVLSEPIATFFEKELDITLDNGHLIRFGKPFRPVIRHYSHIKKQLLKLEHRYGRVSTSIVESRSATGSPLETPEVKRKREDSSSLPFSPAKSDRDDSVDSFDRPTALPHFQTFLRFVDKYLGKQIQLYDRLREGTEERVSFENLWMLFDSKDTIYCPLREAGQEEYSNVESSDHRPVRRHTPQAYRVVATAGGIPFARTMAPTSGMNGVDGSLTRVSLTSPFMEADSKTEVNAIANIFTQAQVATISRKVRNSYSEFYVYCFYVDFNGIEYGTVREVFVFKPYEREMDIRTLQAYPSRSVTNNMFLNRGQSFIDATKVCHMQYEGLTTGPNREDINSPVVVDVKLAFEGDLGPGKDSIEVPKFTSPSTLWLSTPYGEAYDIFGKPTCFHQWCYSRSCTSNVYMESQRKLREKIESEIKLVLEEYESEKQQGKDGLQRFKRLMEEKDIVRLLPGTVPGFALRNRKWVLLDLNLLRPVEQNNEWENLVLPRGHQEMVQAMVETHTMDLGTSNDGTNKIGMDLVRGKGKGCIILLHGVPGVGKTSTAECVAAHTGKPLYPITCGDIGYRPEDVERNMENHFKLAHKWSCVLLLDEADVFLAKRDQRDVQRNGLVSVFLRILEYYSGILFLTTNRVGAIDDAFRSRLHLTLYYPMLTKSQTTKIFKQNFKRIAEINADREKNGLAPFEYRDSEKKVTAWAKQKWTTLRWNGRQIRNTFQTVLALAEFHSKGRNNDSKGPVLTRKHFKIVANASIQFNDYLKATHGYDEDRLAKRDLIRAIEYSPTGSMVYRGREDASDSSSEEGEGSESGDNDESDTEGDSDDSSESDAGKKKKKQKEKKGKSTKNADKKNKKTSEGKGKSKSTKDKKKEKKDKETSDDSD